METCLEILNNIIIVGTALIVLDEPSSNNFPILSIYQIFHHCFLLIRQLRIPPLKESHFTVEKWPMCFLSGWTLSLSESFAFCQHLQSSVENLFNWMKSIACEVASDLTLSWVRVIVALKIKDPKCIKMWMNSHVHHMRWNITVVMIAIFILVLFVAALTTKALCLWKQKNQSETDYYDLSHYYYTEYKKLKSLSKNTHHHIFDLRSKP